MKTAEDAEDAEDYFELPSFTPVILSAARAALARQGQVEGPLLPPAAQAE